VAELIDNHVADEESLTRFVYDSDKVTRSGTIKAGAFLPMQEKLDGRWETSVCRLINCSEDRIWDLARTQRPERTIHARADHTVQSAVATALSCVASPVHGFPEHAVLIGWPIEKFAQKEIALRLAKASAVVFPTVA
jgi:hypothetical protein